MNVALSRDDVVIESCASEFVSRLLTLRFDRPTLPFVHGRAVRVFDKTMAGCTDGRSRGWRAALFIRRRRSNPSPRNDWAYTSAEGYSVRTVRRIKKFSTQLLGEALRVGTLD